MNLIGQFGLVNLNGFVSFFLWIRAVWVNLGGFHRFAWICVDLGWLERIAVDLEDRYELMFVGFGRAQ